MKLLTTMLAMVVCSNLALAKDLKVKIKGLKSSEGKIMIAVYDSKDSWLDVEKAIFQTAEDLKQKEASQSFIHSSASRIFCTP